MFFPVFSSLLRNLSYVGPELQLRVKFFIFFAETKISVRVLFVIHSMDINNPHDVFAKSVMSKIENARDFFNGVLPEGLRELIDLETLRLEKESYVDEELSEFYSDIVYTCMYRGSTVKLVLLFEHKSFLPQDRGTNRSFGTEIYFSA